MSRQILVKFDFSSGYAADIPTTEPTMFLRRGSENVLVTGSGLLKPFRGLTEVNESSATGTITVISKEGLNGKNIIINGVTFVFSTAVNTGLNILFTTADTLAEIATKVALKLNNAAAPVSEATYVAVGTIITVTVDIPGPNGNLFTLSSGTAGGCFIMSGSILAGGAVKPFGSRTNYLTDNGFAGLGDDTPGSGNVAKQIDLLFFIGTGLLRVNGRQVTISGTPVEAATNWQYLTRSNGTFNDTSELFQVGHPQPDKPTVMAKATPSAGQKVMNAAVTVCIWRSDSNTGQPSRSSPASDVLQVTNGSVIVVFPNADSNGQDIWGIGVTLPGLADLGNLYELPTSLGGEVQESTLTYTRTVNGTILSTEDTITIADASFTTADIGRRIKRTADAFDTWITDVLSPSDAKVNDISAITITDMDFVITHAVDGIERAVEISWADTDLLGQNLAPTDGFEPPDGNFAGNLMDTFYIEDLEGTIFYSIPNFFSFPKSRRIFTEDVATVYIDTGLGRHWRVAKQSVAQIFYAAGERPIQAELVSKNVGCKYPQNACLGYGGRLLLWAGRPMIIGLNGQMNADFHLNVASEFADWEDQTADIPVVTAYDPVGLYELWCFGNKIMAMHGPTGRWCAPIYTDAWTAGTIVGQVIVNERLRLVIKENNNVS